MSQSFRSRKGRSLLCFLTVSLQYSVAAGSFDLSTRMVKRHLAWTHHIWNACCWIVRLRRAKVRGRDVEATTLLFARIDPWIVASCNRGGKNIEKLLAIKGLLTLQIKEGENRASYLFKRWSSW